MTGVFDQVRGIAAGVLSAPPAAITTESSPENTANWDSVQHLSLVLALEEKYGVQFLPEEIDQMRTIGGIVNMVETKLGGR